MIDSHRRLCNFAHAAFAVILCCCGVVTASCDDRPNVLIFMADDQYKASIGCFGAFPSHTPSIDRFAMQGMRFNRCITESSICTPNRGVFLTGMVPVKNGADANHSGFFDGVRSLPNFMKDLGYRACIVNKDGIRYPNDVYDWEHRIVESDEPTPGADIPAGRRHRRTRFDQVEAFITADDDRPFCLLHASRQPHTPFLNRLPNGLEGYDASNFYMDSEFGRDLALLDKHGLRNNTVVVYINDNEANIPHDDSGYARDKYTLYDTGINVPLIVRWPGKVKPGSVTDAMVGLTDFLPTFVEIAGGKPDPDWDGTSMLDLWTGEAGSHRSEIYLSYSGVTFGSSRDVVPFPIRGMRTRRYKYLRNLNHTIPHPKKGFNLPPEELYDLAEDPGERTNLIDDPALQDVQRELRDKVDQWMAKTNDKGIEGELATLRRFPPEQPNIVLIMADDLGYGDLSCYGATDITTPVLDRFATEGVRFTNFYANAPECSPTRTALLTGRYQHRVGGLECAIGTGDVGRYDDAVRLQKTGDLGLPLTETTIAQLLNYSGYETVLYGKWHLGYPPKFSPHLRGFDDTLYILGGGADYFHKTEPDGSKMLYRNGELATGPYEITDHMTDIIAAEAANFLQRRTSRQADETPFFLYVPFTAPHFPYQGPDDFSPQPLTSETFQTGDRSTYIEMVEHMDSRIGMILQSLETSGHADNTLVIFCSDNGANPKGSNAPFSGLKGGLYEGGIRVPAIVRWPGKLDPGTTTDQVTITMDFTASIAAAATLEPPSGRAFDGIDVLSLIATEKAPQPRTLFWRQRRGDLTWRAVRSGDMKYLSKTEGDAFEEHVYNLADDPAEEVDLLPSQLNSGNRLKAQLAAWEEAVKPAR